MAHLFVLIKYAFGIEATRNITPGCEPTTEEAWDAVDSERWCRSLLSISSL